MASSAQLLKGLDGLNVQQLKRLLVEQLTRQKLGLYWESNAIERDQALNAQVVLPRLVSEWSHGLEGAALAEGAANLIIEGDNFDSLRLLKSTHAGKIRVIYIDPPYNTGNKDWVYNDHFVGANDRWRHSQWLEFLYRRLLLAKDLLTQDGVIMVSINDENRSRLEMLMDEVFPGKRLGSLVWRTKDTGNDLSQRFSHVHEHVLVYANAKFGFNGRATDRSKFRNPDADLRGDWSAQPLTKAHTYIDRENTYYPVQDPNTGYWYPCDPNRVWAYASEKAIRARLGSDENAIAQELSALRSDTMEALIDKQMIYFPPCDAKQVMQFDTKQDLIKAIRAGKGPILPKKKTALLREDLPDLDFWICKPIAPGRPSRKEHWTAKPEGERLAPLSSWIAGQNEIVAPLAEEGEDEPVTLRSTRGGVATDELKSILGSKAFPYPKPQSLIEGLISQASRPGDIVLDFFAGSGTTGHAVLNLNALEPDKPPRSFILCSSTEATAKEPEKNLCRDVCAERIRRVIGSDAKLIHNRFAYLQLDKIAPGDAPFESDCGHAFQLLTMRLGKVARPVPSVKDGVKIIIQSESQGSMTVLVHRLSTAAMEALAALPLSSNPRFGHLRVYSSRPVAVREHLERAWDGTRRTVESLSLSKALTQGQIAPRRKLSGGTAASADTMNSIAPRADSMPASGLFGSENDANNEPKSSAGGAA